MKSENAVLRTRDLLRQGSALARNALLDAAPRILPTEPMAPVFVRATRRLTGAAEVEPLLSHWSSRAVGNPTGNDRYRWELTHQRGTGLGRAIGELKHAPLDSNHGILRSVELTR